MVTIDGICHYEGIRLFPCEKSHLHHPSRIRQKNVYRYRPSNYRFTMKVLMALRYSNKKGTIDPRRCFHHYLTSQKSPKNAFCIPGPTKLFLLPIYLLSCRPLRQLSQSASFEAQLCGFGSLAGRPGKLDDYRFLPGSERASGRRNLSLCLRYWLF